MNYEEIFNIQFTYKDGEYVTESLTNYSFKLPDSFIEQYAKKKVNWTDIAYVTYKNKYARAKDNGRLEEWYETVRRVVETVYTIQKWYISETTGSYWSDQKAIASAKTMYDLMFNFKFLPGGRGLFGMDIELLAKKGSGSLFNCSFSTTDFINHDFSFPFVWTMMMSFLGVGVGFDTLGKKYNIKLREPKITDDIFIIPDSKEGWTQAVELILKAYDPKSHSKIPKDFDYSLIRPKGAQIKTFGGIAPGPEPLKLLIRRLKFYLDSYIKNDKPVDAELIVDIMNAIGEAVVAGGVRRTAMIAMGDINDDQFIKLKEQVIKDKGFDIPRPRWASNNSVVAEIGSDYSGIINNIIYNGEPGIIYLENARAYSRMKDPADYRDKNIMGVNPCVTGDTVITLDNFDRHTATFKELAEEGKDVKVLCYDTENHKFTSRMLRHPRVTRKDEDIYELVVETNNGDIYKFKTTNDHKFFVGANYIREMFEYESGEYKELKDMNVGDTIDLFTLVGDHIESTIKEINYIGKEDVYNGTVDDFHNYFIGAFDKDGNPVEMYTNTRNCGEIGLEHTALCNLVETFPSNHDSEEEYFKTLKYAYLYGKTVTLLKTHDKVTNSIIMKTRRIGVSVSGVVQAIDKFGYRRLFEMLDKGYNIMRGYDDTYSDWFAIPKSIKISTIKPSGTVSILANTTPGVHYPHSQYQYRLVEVQSNSPILPILQKAGYKTEVSVYKPTSHVVYFPIENKNFTKSKLEATIWEKMNIVADLQKYWSDNLVSVTVDFIPERDKNNIKLLLEMYEDKIKGVSFLPVDTTLAEKYPQLPNQEIDKETYESYIKDIKSFSLKTVKYDYTAIIHEQEFCDGDTCQADLAVPDEEIGLILNKETKNDKK